MLELELFFFTAKLDSTNRILKKVIAIFLKYFENCIIIEVLGIPLYHV